MMNSSEFIQSIIQDRIDGLETITSYQAKPRRIKVTSADFYQDLESNFFILNTRKLPVVDKLSIISSDNVFDVTPDEYDTMDEYRYQCFFDYLEVKTTVATFQPYFLEVIEVIPHR